MADTVGQPARRRSAAAAVALVGASLLTACALLRRIAREEKRRKARRGAEEPPMAVPSLPVLGNALAYKADPAGFLQRQRNELGTTFSLNLAGLRMAVVAGRHEMVQVATAGEAVLSAQAATADFGFGETLGEFNVYFGTDLHKVVLKSTGLAELGSETCSTELAAAIATAVDAALPLGQDGSHGSLRDMLDTMRRAMLHTVVLHLLGSGVLAAFNGPPGRHSRDLLSEFMVFQDRVEDATTKGVALPSWLSRPLIWWPVRLRRWRLRRRLAEAVAAVWAPASGGEARRDTCLRAPSPCLAARRSGRPLARHPAALREPLCHPGLGEVSPAPPGRRGGSGGGREGRGEGVAGGGC
mmetsp:Transcript_129559/g.415387  ORF Transcript_129559/g.415387 Transcript_129559/m.415387 type:complete len:355 (-) Transcript_129559:631-1695(-)